MKYVIGIDEVGRGPLSGPVTVVGVLCDTTKYAKLKKDTKLPVLGKDSKKLSPKLRHKYSQYLRQIKVIHAVTHISHTTIDTIGISHAIRKAIKSVLKSLMKEMYIHNTRAPYSNVTVLLDGGLRAPSEFVNQKTIIKGDEKEKIIAWASILAKVSRDARMVRLAKKYPEYGFEIHKGYGTRAHREAIKRCGLSPVHRKSFCKNV